MRSALALILPPARSCLAGVFMAIELIPLLEWVSLSCLLVVAVVLIVSLASFYFAKENP